MIKRLASPISEYYKINVVQQNIFLPIILFSIFSQSISSQSFILQPDSTDGKDCVVWSNAPPANNYGDRPSLNFYTWTNGGILATKRSMIEFDLSDFSTNMNLENASLSLYFNPTDPFESVDIHSGNNAFYIERIVSTWLENEVTWSSQPETTMLNRVEVSETISGEQDFLNIDVTQLVIDMLDDPENSHGLLLKMQNENDPYRMIILASSDHPNSNYHPKLELEFEECIEDIQLDFELYPNPIFKERDVEIEIEISANKTDIINLMIFDALGRLVQKGNIIGNENHKTNISRLDSGVYFMMIQNDKGISKTHKFIIV